MDLDDVADELYSLPPEEFTAARTAREKEAKATGNTLLATRIKQLQKPDAAAWLANQLAREHAEEIRPLLALGAALREATASLSGEQLRELGKQQRLLIHALVRQARELATSAGRRVTDATARDLETTLHAALADASAGEALAAGRLTRGLESIGFGPDATPNPAASSKSVGPNPAASSRKPRSIDSAPSAAARRQAAALDQARDDERRTASDATNAGRASDRAAAAVADAEQRVADAAAEVDRLRAELQDASDTLTAAETARHAARGEATRTQRLAAAADQRAAAAKERRERLSR